MPNDPIEVEVVEIDGAPPPTRDGPPPHPRDGSIHLARHPRRFVQTTASPRSSLLTWFLGILFFIGLLVFGLFALAGFLLLLIVRSLLSLFRPPPSRLSHP